MASIRDTLANLVEQYKASDTPMANLMRGDTEGAKQSVANTLQQATLDPYSGLNVLGTTKLVGKTTQELAHATAQKNAAEMLGLHPENTAMERAKAMGYDIDQPVYHGSSADITKFSNRMANRGYGTSVAEQAKNAEGYAQNGAIYPLLINKNTILDVTNPSQVEQLSKVTDEYLSNVKPYDNQTTFYPFTKENVFEGFKKPYSAYYAEQRLIPELAKRMGYTGTKALEDNMPQYKIYNPKNIRSQFAAFDPAKANEPDLLAGAMALPIATDKEKRNKIIDLLKNK